MKSRTLNLCFILSIIIMSLTLLQAQPVAAPTPDRSISSRNFEGDSYNVTNSFEVGYRFAEVGGDSGLYRATENYGYGLRLFGSSFTANSIDGHGMLFDSLSINTMGLGNDPYSVASMRIEKNDVYRYDMTWRSNDYFNPAFLDGASRNLLNTNRVMQDHDLAIILAKWAKLKLGYSRNHDTGPAFSTYEEYIGGLARSVVPLDQNMRQDWNEYRLGGQFDFLGFRLSLSHQWDFYKEDTEPASLIPGQPYPVPNTSLATSYLRSAPMHIQTPGWFGNLNRSGTLWAMNARITYSKADQSSIYYENETGPGVAKVGVCNNCGVGPPAVASTYMPGAALQPFTAGDLTFSLFPTDRLTIVNSISATNDHIAGSGPMLQVNTSAATKSIFWYQDLGEKRVSDSLDANYRFTNWLGLNAEYRYTDRRLDNNLIRTGTTKSTDINTMSDHLNTGTLGFRIKPLQPVTINLDASLGIDNAPETPVSLAHYHNIKARVQYAKKRMRFGATYRQLYNLNAPVLFAYYSSHSRDFSVNSSFEVHHNLSLDLSYSKTHLDTFADLYAELPTTPDWPKSGKIANVRGYVSQYISNIHTVSAIARTAIKDRATLYVGYNITRDTGDGRAAQNLLLQDPAAAYLALANTFPMTYQAPLARLSIKLSPKLRWNAGWEFYRYNQKFAYFAYQPYFRAQTGYTSLSFAF